LSAAGLGTTQNVSFSHPAERVDVLDGFRGLAIALVVWYHAWLVSGQTIGGLNFVAEAGFLGVDLFFFISGFCIFFPYARARGGARRGPNTRRFFARRAMKILPSYLLALGVFAIVYHARFASPGEALLQIVSHVAFIHPLSALTFGAISGPLWTIGIEVQFYLLFPLLLPLWRRSPVLGYVALIAVSETYRLIVGASGLGSTFVFINQLPAYLDVFGAGMFAAYLHTTLKAPTTRNARRCCTLGALGASMAALAVLAYVASLARVDINATYDWVNEIRFALGPLCIALALSTTFAVERYRALVTAPPIVFLSMISYNLYLWNLEIAVWYHQAGFPPWATFALGIGTAVLLATAITYAVERPLLEADIASLFRELAPRLRGRWSAARTGSETQTAT
jgi:peptidoglycan/LPS O-acetylase OafA/YrhL